MINNRIKEIKRKGFEMGAARDTQRIIEDSYVPTDFGRIKVGIKTLDDAVLDLSTYKRIDGTLGDRNNIMSAIQKNDTARMREISNFFYRESGIYARLCRYMAFLYRYDWMVTPYIKNLRDLPKREEKKALGEFNEVLTFLDDFQAKKNFGDIALKVIRNGCYYGYVVEGQSGSLAMQELPAQYCRSLFTVNGVPAVEFNLKYFDETFRDSTELQKVLNLFPSEFKKAYKLFKEGTTTCWTLLDTNRAIKFNINGEDFPMMISVIPALIDLDEAQEIDKKRMLQRLLKLVVQKMPMDKNGDLIFDVEEARQLHNNAVAMLGRAVGVDVLTTFADVQVQDMSDRNTTTTVDDLAKVERSVFNEAGVSQKQFNTDGNLALEKSTLNDEASIYNLVLQFEQFLNRLINKFNSRPKKVTYRVQILGTTIYNYKELSKMYKEQMQLGFSKMLPQIAMGQSQSSILATAYFENDLLNLTDVFIPPMMSSTMNSDVLNRVNAQGKSASSQSGDTETGRPTNESKGEEISEKTAQNLESQS